jgi:hypothetical protein
MAKCHVRIETETNRETRSLKSKAERKDPERLRRAERKYRDDEY